MCNENLTKRIRFNINAFVLNLVYEQAGVKYSSLFLKGSKQNFKHNMCCIITIMQK